MTKFSYPAQASPLVAALALAFSGPLAAQSAASAGDSTLTLGSVKLEGRSSGTLPVRSVYSSVDIVGASLLEDQHVDYSWELLTRAPGVQVTQFKQGTDAGRFSFRGFNGEGRVNAVKLLIDGIPSNDNAGGMPFLDAVFPLDIEAIEIVRGTSDARYGLNNIAGNANVRTRQGGHEGRTSLTVGSFGTKEVEIVQGLEQGNWSQNYGFSYRDSQGYRDHAEAEKFSLSGKWFYTSDDRAWKAGLSARFFKNKALEAGYLSYEQAMSVPRTSPAYAADDRGERETGQISLHLEAQLAADLAWSAKAYVNRYENQRWVRFSAAGVQQERDSYETQRGLLTTLTWRPRVSWAHEFTLEGGLDAQWQSNTSERYRTLARVRTSQIRNWDFDFNTQGAYVQAVIRPIEALKIIPALRIDHMGGDFNNLLAGTSAPTHDYGLIKQPKLSLVYTLAPQASVYGNWGRTFQVGAGMDAYRTQARNLSPSINEGFEAGLKFSPMSWLDGRVAYWEQHASGEVGTVLGVDGTVDTAGSGNVGKTLRKGYDLQINATLRPGTQAWLTYSHQKATIVEPDASAAATRGKEIENVPNELLTAGLDHQLTPAIKLSAWANAQGNYYIERSNTLGRVGNYVVLNVSANYRVSPSLALSLQLKNLNNRHYVYAWYDSGSSGYAPADGRSAYLSADWSY